MTRYDAEKDAYHCSYGIPAPPSRCSTRSAS